MQLTFTPLAEQDLEAIADYIANDNPSRALTFVRELRTQCQRIAFNPEGYRLRTELDNDIRSCAYGHYVIFFIATSDEVCIIRIMHGARDISTAINDGQ